MTLILKYFFSFKFDTYFRIEGVIFFPIKSSRLNELNCYLHSFLIARFLENFYFYLSVTCKVFFFFKEREKKGERGHGQWVLILVTNKINKLTININID